MAVETEKKSPATETEVTSESSEPADLEPQDQSSVEAEAANPDSTAVDQEKSTAEDPPLDSDVSGEIASTSETIPVEADVEASSLPPDEDPVHLNRILNMKVPIIVQIAKKKMKVGEVMKLNIGTVIQFDQDAYQYIDLMVNNEVIGLGQPVKLGEKFGLKITQLSDITHTIKSLGVGPDSGS
jgi:flagellar motor switch/type III secretory pathway protein FliN